MASKELSRSLNTFQCLSKPSIPPSRISRSLPQRRHESSYRRQIQRLSIPPAPSFTNAPNKASPAPSSSHVIFNPPSSSPNVYHTPQKFLPLGDKRRALYAGAASMYNMSTPTPTIQPSDALSAFAKPGTQLHESHSTHPSGLRPSVPKGMPLPQSLKALHRKKYHLGPEEITEMKRLRKEDPKQWSLLRLAEKFQCSQLFVQIACKNEDAGREHERRRDEARKLWGPRKMRARVERVRRRELWGRDA